jgi:ADP-ribose pyrophosphatase YjhB (NUDIX family)
VAANPLHVVAVTGFVRDAAGRVLLVRVLDRGWELPGGQVEEGEWLTAALEREVADTRAVKRGLPRTWFQRSAGSTSKRRAGE